MESISTKWKISELKKLKKKINPQPQYQRGAVWNPNKEKLLIDSILRDYDMPKIYLRRTLGGFYDYEVADGQQRLNAIWKFAKNKFCTDKLYIDNVDLSNSDYTDLPKKFKDIFDNYEIDISIIENASEDDIRSLFSRLQMGVQLNQAELRNAINSKLGNSIHAIALTHKFFINSRINEKRFNRQDFITHLLLLIINDKFVDLKAPNLREFYKQYAINYPNYKLNNLMIVLDSLFEINERSNKIVRNKWTFVDFGYFLYQNIDKVRKIDFNAFAQKLVAFEAERRKFNSEPEKLIQRKKVSDRDYDLYNYINAFKISGAIEENIKKRNSTIKNKFKFLVNGTK
jgi:hypothetical protein